MLPKEIIKKIKRLRLRLQGSAKAACRELPSTFRGRGIEFSEVREYPEGDDGRSIDWNVTARMNAPFREDVHGGADLTRQACGRFSA
jgi:uncharacterized protein (DUF58 family)